MANQDDPGASLAPYPQPPAYLWTRFTDENAYKIQELRDQHSQVATLTAAYVAPDVPEDLALLQAPPPPQNGRWRVFGQMYTLGDQLPTLEEQGVTRLGEPMAQASTDKATHSGKMFELKKLSKSLLLNFLELAGILATNPHDAADKLADLQTIFYNMHQHINEWRPHQTREALISLLQSHLERTRNETRALHEATDSVRATLVGLENIKDPTVATAGGGSENHAVHAEASSADSAVDVASSQLSALALETDRRRQAAAFAALDDIFG